ncbi:MAG TPA: flagellar biosynthetic protein FliO [Gammaproteobacteria bacterium]|nr:flagellar biosynthetic protein FliO [Gammaproteobacteria bacterium]
MAIKQFFYSIVILTTSFPVSAEVKEKAAAGMATSPDVTLSLLKVSGGLFLVIIAIFGAAWAYRRYGNMTPIANDALRVIGGVSMGQKERVVLMQVGEEQVLLGVTPGRIQRLHVLKKNIEIPAEKTDKKKAFSSQLTAAMKQGNEQL